MAPSCTKATDNPGIFSRFIARCMRASRSAFRRSTGVSGLGENAIGIVSWGARPHADIAEATTATPNDFTTPAFRPARRCGRRAEQSRLTPSRILRAFLTPPNRQLRALGFGFSRARRSPQLGWFASVPEDIHGRPETIRQRFSAVFPPSEHPVLCDKYANSFEHLGELDGRRVGSNLSTSLPFAKQGLIQRIKTH